MISTYRGSVNPEVSIIILHLNNIPCLVDCISSLNKISYPNFDIFVVHNGAKSNALTDTLTQLSEHISEIIDTGDNIGFAGGNNIGIRRALEKGADYVLLLNDDTEVSKDFLSLLVQCAEKRQDAGMLGPKIFYFDEPGKIWFSGASFDSRTCTITTHGSDQINEDDSFEPVISDYITGCALLIKKAVVEKIGLLDERFFLYWEDVDWGLRAKKAGLKNFVVPQSRILHRVSVSTGGIDSPLRAYHKTRSHLLMAKLHSPKALTRLHMGFFRDIAWLFLKSKDRDRIRKAQAYMAAIIDYHRGGTDRGPQWLWND